VQTADRSGLDLVGIQDHPYQRHFFDTWSLIPLLLQETRNVSFFTDVANLPLRPPAVMAKAAATLDVLSDGRSSSVSARAGCWTSSRASAVRGDRRASPWRPSTRRST
jgi:luciferase-like monooxygenase